MPKPTLSRLVSSLALGALLATTTVAEAELGGVSAPNVRLAALIGGPFAPPGFVFRSKGVAAVTHPKLGLWCITPSFTSDVSNLVPMVWAMVNLGVWHQAAAWSSAS